MRVVLDATPLLLRSAGVKTYLFHWVTSMQRTAGRHSVSLFPWLSRGVELNHETSTLGRASTKARTWFVYAMNSRFLNIPDVGIIDAFVRADLFYFTQALVRPPHRSKLAATLHDMSCWTVPETHTAENIAATKGYIDLIRARANGVIAVSNSARNDAVRIGGFPESRVRVIYPGVSERYFTVSEEDAAAAKRRFGLAKSYVLFVGAIEPRKNIDRLMDAWDGLREELRDHYDLVIAGPRFWALPKTLSRLEHAAGSVKYLGYVDEMLLPGLTAGAYAIAYPSLYEGFGLPLAQGLAAGVPAVTSNVSSMPEVAADAAFLVDPYSVSELRSALEKLLECPELRNGLALKARHRGLSFQWDKNARQSWTFFEQICGR